MSKTTYHFFFKNLANPLKVDIIVSLNLKPKSVGEIVNDLKVEQSKISHALSSLKSCNIVQVERRGKERFYSLNKDTIIPMLKLIDNHSLKHCKGKCVNCGELCRK